MDSKYEHGKFIIERFDHYYDSVNNKGAFYIGLNTFIFSGICVGYTTLFGKVNAQPGIWILMIGLLACCLLSTLFTIRAIMPFLKDNQHRNPQPSLLYFGGIARHELPHFKEKFQSLGGSEMLDDLVQQAHCLAMGLDQKYKNLKRASHFVVAQFLIMVPLLLFVAKNLKQ